MHYHLEIVMPPTKDVKAAVEQIMHPFCERNEGEERSDHAFWDFYVIGGRWSGEKLYCQFSQERRDAFYKALSDRKVTVSSFTSGKQELAPASQIPMVDALWCEMFPDSAIKVCPFFKHYNDQYVHSEGFPDIQPLKDVPKELACGHVIIAGPHWDEKDHAGELEANYMVQESMYNGVTWVDVKWDGKFASAIEAHNEHLKHMSGKYAMKHSSGPDWLVVTVDYHS